MNLTKKNLIYLMVALLMGSFLTLGINDLEQSLQHYFFAQELNSRTATAQLVTAKEKKEPIERPDKFDVELNANSAISVWTNLKDSKVLFEKKPKNSLPIASLSKLMTNFVVMDLDETYSLNQPIVVTSKSVKQDGNFQLKPGEELTTKNLMAMSLISSSNDAAYALADYIGEKGFVGLMNYYAEKMNLDQTKFYNPTGLKVEEEPENYSSVEDLVKLSKEILRKHPLIFELSSKESYKVRELNGLVHHRIENTNILLNDYPQIIGSKTGFTDNAKKCLLTVVKHDQGYVINVLLGSNDRFGEMEKLINQVR
ncbi:MAG: serine hydrolase [Candidatus Paceibacterota bacterium]